MNVSLINRNFNKRRRASVSVASRTTNERDEVHTAMALLWRSELVSSAWRLSTFETRLASAFAHQRHHLLLSFANIDTLRVMQSVLSDATTPLSVFNIFFYKRFFPNGNATFVFVYSRTFVASRVDKFIRKRVSFPGLL